MKLTIKPKKRNLQPLYDDIVKSYKNGTLEDMKILSREFIDELISTKITKYNFNKKIDKCNKDNLLLFITNIHMQDSQETSSLR